VSGFSYNATYHAGAAVDATGYEYKIVKRGANAGGKAIVELCTAAAIDSIGVVQDVGLGSVGQSLAVCVGGVCKVKLGGVFTPGTTRAAFTSDASGLAVAAADNELAVGYLLMDEAVTYASGDVVNAIVNISNQGA
jgi:hypothetical protein